MFFKKSRAQGSLEYLMVVAVILAVAGIVVYFVANSSGKSVTDSNFAECKKAANQCQGSRLLAPNDPCLFCEKACTVNGKDILEGTGFSAVELCKQGDSESIYKRKVSGCGNGELEEGEVCDGGSVDCSVLGDYESGTQAPCLSDCSGYDESVCEIVSFELKECYGSSEECMENCTDERDNDNDGSVDCEDSDCSSYSGCV